jgi:hypothetical protein
MIKRQVPRPITKCDRPLFGTYASNSTVYSVIKVQRTSILSINYDMQVEYISTFVLFKNRRIAYIEKINTNSVPQPYCHIIQFPHFFFLALYKDP